MLRKSSLLPVLVGVLYAIMLIQAQQVTNSMEPAQNMSNGTNNGSSQASTARPAGTTTRQRVITTTLRTTTTPPFRVIDPAAVQNQVAVVLLISVNGTISNNDRTTLRDTASSVISNAFAGIRQGGRVNNDNNTVNASANAAAALAQLSTAVSSIGSLAVSLASAGNVDTGLEMMSSAVSACADSVGDSSNGVDPDSKSAAIQLINILQNVLGQIARNLEDGARRVIGVIIMAKDKVTRANNIISISIGLAKREVSSVAFVGGVNENLLSSNNNVSLSITSLSTPSSFVNQNASRTDFQCLYQYASNYIVTVAADNSSNVPIGNERYVMFVNFYTQNAIAAECNFSLARKICARYDSELGAFNYNDCYHVNENGTDRCFCSKFGTVALFYSTFKQASDVLSGLTSFNKSNINGLGPQLLDVGSQLQNLFNLNRNNRSLSKQIFSSMLSSIDESLVAINASDPADAIALFQPFFNLDSTFYSSVSTTGDNLATQVLQSFEKVLKKIKVTDQFSTTGSGFQALGFKPRSVGLNGVRIGPAGGLAAANASQTNASSVDSGTIGAFFNSAALPDDVSVYFLSVETNSSLGQSLLGNSSGCSGIFVNSQLVIASTDVTIANSGSNLLTLNYYQNQSVSSSSCSSSGRSFTFKCVFYDTASSSWNTSGLTHTYDSSGFHSCASTHLTAFSLQADSGASRIGGMYSFTTTIGAGLFVLYAVFARN